MIRAQNLSVYFGGRILFDQLSFAINSGEKVAITGRNGAGKSTLFKLLTGQLLPDSGYLELQGQPVIGSLRQELPPDKGLSVFDEVKSSLENIAIYSKELEELHSNLEIVKDAKALESIITRMEHVQLRLDYLDVDKLDGLVEKILSGLGFKQGDFSRKTSEFSGGWRMRIEIAKLLVSKPDLLLLDEPNNHLDLLAMRWLEDYLHNYEGTVLLISHDLAFLDNIANRILEIDRSRLYDFKGNYSSYKVYRKQRQEVEMKEYTSQQKMIQQKEMLIDKFRYKASKASFAQSLIHELERMDRIQIPEAEMGTMQLRFSPSNASGLKVFELKHVYKSYGEHEVLKDVNLFVERGTKLSFIGANGNGKSTLVKIITGDSQISKGEASLGHNVRIGYYAQEHEDILDHKATALEAVESSALPETRSMVRSILGGLGFSGEDTDKKISVLSGGEKARVRLALLLVKEHNLLILDEPTHHLDIPSKERLKNALQNYQGTLIIVSHDREFLKGLAEKTILFTDQTIKIYEGDIEYYLEKTQKETLTHLATNETSTYQDKPKSGGDYQQRKKSSRQIQNIEKEIQKIEDEISKIEAAMSAEDFYLKTDHLQTLENYSNYKKRLNDAYSAWDDLLNESTA